MTAAGCWDSPRARGSRSRPWPGCRWIREELASARSWDFFSVGRARLVRARGPGRAPGGGRSEPDPEIGDPLRACAGAARAERGPRGDGAGARKARDGGSCRSSAGPREGADPPLPESPGPGERGNSRVRGPGACGGRPCGGARGNEGRPTARCRPPVTGHRSPPRPAEARGATRCPPPCAAARKNCGETR